MAGRDFPGTPFNRGGRVAPPYPALPADSALKSTVTGGIDTQEERDVLVSPLTTLFPQYISRAVYASEISVLPSVSISAGEAGWFMLRSFRVPQDLQECAYIGMEATLSPTDVDGTATPSAGAAAAWGDVNGMKAQIVVAFNTGLQQFQWASRVAYLPGLDTNLNNLLCRNNMPEYVATVQFPPGKFTATTPTKLYASSRFLPAASRLIKSDSLDVCLVVNRDQVNAAALAGESFVGNIDLRLHFLPIAGGKTFGKT